MGWSWTAFFVGFLIAVVAVLIIIWILYINRLFVFHTCTGEEPTCKRSDYINNPTDAINDGYSINTVLSIHDNKMYFTRPVNNNSCVPGNNQTVLVPFPEFCSFETDQGSYEGTNGGVGSKYVFTTLLGEEVIVDTSNSCVPVSSEPDIVISGKPVLKWT